VAKGQSRREAPSGGGVWGGGPPPQGRGSGVITSGKFLKFETQFDAIWCIFGKKLTFLQLSTFVNENTVIVLDSGIDIVTYYFNYLVV